MVAAPNETIPFETEVELPICVVLSNNFTSEFASAVPTIFGVWVFVVSEEFVITGAAGGVVSTVTVIFVFATFPAVSVALTRIV